MIQEMNKLITEIQTREEMVKKKQKTVEEVRTALLEMGITTPQKLQQKQEELEVELLDLIKQLKEYREELDTVLDN